MYIRYDDIITRIPEPPKWWQNGVPRYEPFRPEDTLAAYQVALVHTECQACGQRYDVAAQPRAYRNLRNVFAYTSEMDVGDPPNALHEPRWCTGTVMSSLQIEVLEFWERREILKGWQRDTSMERPMVDWDRSGDVTAPIPVFLRISRSDRRDEWLRAVREGDFEALVALLDAFECDRPRDVAHMLSIESLDLEHRNQLDTLRVTRFGKDYGLIR